MPILRNEESPTPCKECRLIVGTAISNMKEWNCGETGRYVKFDLLKSGVIRTSKSKCKSFINGKPKQILDVTGGRP